MNWTFKPKNTTIDLETLKPEDLEYYCTNRHVDKLIMHAIKEPFDEKLADDMDKYMRTYFIVKKNREYDVKSGVLFEGWMVAHGLLLPRAELSEFAREDVPEMEITRKAAYCRMDFVTQCVKQIKNKNGKK